MSSEEHRFVGDEHLRLGRQRAGEHDALPLAARELVREAVEEIDSRREPHQLQQTRRPGFRFVGAADPVIDERLRERMADALARVERRVRVLEHHLRERALASRGELLRGLASVDRDASESGSASRRRAAERRLAAAALADQREDLAARDVDRHVVDRAHARASAERAAAYGERLARRRHMNAGVARGAARRRLALACPKRQSPPRATPALRPAAPGCQQRTKPSVDRFRGGISTRQRCVARGQRGWNRHPGGGYARSGTSPVIVRSAGSPPSGITHSMSPRVYGCCGSAKIRSTGPYSTIWPAYITQTWSASSATRPKSCVTKIIAEPVWRRIVRMRSMICACTVTSSAVVGSSRISSRGRLATAIAIITR
jgi:hypothetical protein